VCFPDAGKSTIGGQIMSLTGMVDKRTLEKYEREAREKSRESWYLSWALDTNQEGELAGGGRPSIRLKNSVL
jgi:peptide chain release factor subunit 3